MAKRDYLNADTFAIFRETEEDTEGKLVGAQQSVKVAITPNYTEVTAMDTDGVEQNYQGYSWTVDVSGIAVEEAELNELFQAPMTGKEYTIIFKVFDTVYDGVVKIGSFELSGEAKELGKYSFSLLGNGELNNKKIPAVIDGGA